MDETAGALLCGAAWHWQAGRFIGQESGITEILNRLASMGTFSDLDTVVFLTCGPRCNGCLMQFFSPGNLTPPKRDNYQQQGKHKYLNHFNVPLKSTLTDWNIGHFYKFVIQGLTRNPVP